ncbi:MAG: T9SS type A sorting domain-containing protein [Bacteroidetes bacterium]|nr:T9SS type A sorting domain-containing protein [Bacteroidota bacterium]
MKKLLLSTVLLFTAIILNAQTMYVDIDATGNNDGTSWANAFTNLDTALANWDIVLWGGEIWVAEGTYKPGDGISRTAAFNVKSNMFGGFNGTETNRGDRDIAANPTILSGDLLGNDNGNISSTEITRADNSYSVVYSGWDAQLNGFIIEGGHANATTGGDQNQAGAAIYNMNNGMIITNCVFRNNYGEEDGAIVKFRGPAGYNSWFNLHGNEFYNNVSNRSMVSSTRPSTLVYWCYMRIYNNLFHHNEVKASNASIVCATNHVNGGSLSMGDYSYLIYHNTFVNNIIPNTGGTIGHGRNDINGTNDGWGELNIEVVGNIIWDDAPTLVEYSMVSGSIDTSTQFYFMSNVIKGTDTIQNADLMTYQPYITGNVYDEYPMFVDTATNDYRIIDCAAPGNDIVNYTNQNLTISTDFYGNDRPIGFAADAGHSEVTQEAAPVTVQQVGTTLEATAGYANYSWFLGQPPYTQYAETSNVLTPTDGDGQYFVLAMDDNFCKTLGVGNYCSSVTVSIDLINDTLFATGNGGNSYAWYLDGNPVGTNDDIFVPTTPGTYTVAHYLWDGTQVVGCTGTAAYEITCSNMQAPVISENNGVLSVNDDYTTYQWYLGTNAISGANSASYTPTVSGDYSVEVTDNFNCGIYSNPFSFCLNFNLTISQSDSTLIAGSGFTNYQWYLDGNAISGATSQTYTATQNGTYTCQAENSGCTGTSNSLVVDLGTGIKDISLNGLSVYPNPANDIVNIKVNEALTAIVLFDLTGKVVKAFDANNMQLNVADIQQGIYFLELKNNEKRSVVKLAIK